MVITLKNGPLRAVTESLGGELISLKDESDREYIWQGNPEIWSGKNPNLFPIVGRLRDGKVFTGDFLCEMPQHGFARRREFEAVSQGEDYVEYRLSADEETKKSYPFDFSFHVIHRLKRDGFETEFVVCNNGKEIMPFCVGAHTGFNCPIEFGKTFSDYELLFSEEEDTATLSFDEEGYILPEVGNAPFKGKSWPLSYEYFDKFDTLIFEGLCSKEVCLRPKNGGRGVKVNFEGWPMIAFWTKPHSNAPYICIEPWQGCAACSKEEPDFYKKRHVVTLSPGEKWQRSFGVTLIDENEIS